MARYGWQSSIPSFVATDPKEIISELYKFPGDSGPQQDQAWRTSINWLQHAFNNVIAEEREIYSHNTILEFELPRDFRRPDVIILRSGAVVVLEVKGSVGTSQAALDQVLAYARDLRAYHIACSDVPVVPVLVPSNGPINPTIVDGVRVVGPSGVDKVLTRINNEYLNAEVKIEDFLQDDAYAPLPTIVQAARDLFHGRKLPFIKRARAATEPAIDTVSKISHHAARTKSRHLVLVSGVPGAGKTLVGLQVVHAGWLDDLAVQLEGRNRGSAAVYLSGNGPLVAVLQDALRDGDMPGSMFVQDIKKYVAYYSRSSRTPPEHIIVFDEAQRAHDADRVAQVHKQPIGPSEPDHLIDFCDRIPEWSVLVGLIGSGQAIHVGEEGGIKLWRDALKNAKTNDDWTVHAPSAFEGLFTDVGINFEAYEALNLDTEIRFHLAPKLDVYIEGLLSGEDPSKLNQQAESLYSEGFRYLLTRDLEVAKDYVRKRYEEAPETRYGLLASSKDKWLPTYGVHNTFQTTKRLKVGPWYNREKTDELSCCQLNTVATEFSSQGLELDFVILSWGSDLLWSGKEWSMNNSRGTRGIVHNPLQIRKNVYRVLLTRGRDGTIIFVPPDSRFDLTFEYLKSAGFKICNED